MKILAVDDDPIILDLLSEALSASGYHDVTLAASGAEALDSIANQDVAFDCFLLDIQMPEMDGIELCNWIKSIPGYSRAQVIMVTAMSDKSYVDRAFSAGATDYVTKPFDILELGTRLGLARKLIDERKKVNDGICAVAALQNELNTKLHHRLEEPVEIQGVERTIGYLAFENYLLQLTRGSLFFSSVFAVKIANVEQIHSAHSAKDFQNILTKVAGVISDKLKFANSFISYRGNGTFVCICHRGSAFSRPDLEFAIRENTDGLKLVAESGLPMRPDIILGEIVSPGVFANPGSLVFLHKAVENAENECLNKVARQEYTHQIAYAVRSARQQDYEAILRDSLSDGLQPIEPKDETTEKRSNAA